MIQVSWHIYVSCCRSIWLSLAKGHADIYESCYRSSWHIWVLLQVKLAYVGLAAGNAGIYESCYRSSWHIWVLLQVTLAYISLNLNVNVNICNALEFPKEQKCRYLLWSIEAKMVRVCFELRSEWTDAGSSRIVTGRLFQTLGEAIEKRRDAVLVLVEPTVCLETTSEDSALVYTARAAMISKSAVQVCSI